MRCFADLPPEVMHRVLSGMSRPQLHHLARCSKTLAVARLCLLQNRRIHLSFDSHEAPTHYDFGLYGPLHAEHETVLNLAPDASCVKVLAQPAQRLALRHASQITVSFGYTMQLHVYTLALLDALADTLAGTKFKRISLEIFVGNADMGALLDRIAALSAFPTSLKLSAPLPAFGALVQALPPVEALNVEVRNADAFGEKMLFDIGPDLKMLKIVAAHPLPSLRFAGGANVSHLELNLPLNINTPCLLNRDLASFANLQDLRIFTIHDTRLPHCLHFNVSAFEKLHTLYIAFEEAVLEHDFGLDAFAPNLKTLFVQDCKTTQIRRY